MEERKNGNRARMEEGQLGGFGNNAGKKCDMANIKGMVLHKGRRLDFSSMLQIGSIKLPNG